ncbi:MAG: hypothetical protein ACTHMX_10935, partial [Thermomicrobiales bacterium]
MTSITPLPTRFDRLAAFIARRIDRRTLAGGFTGGLLLSATGGRGRTGMAAARMRQADECSLGCEDSACGEVPAGCTLFPADNAWNVPVDTLPVATGSAAYIASMGADTGLHPDFGAGLYDGFPLGIPFVRAPADQPMVAVSFEVPEESDPGPYPIPPDAPVEGGSCGEGDRHVIVVQAGTCQLWELYSATQQPDGSWTAFS